MSQGKDQRGRRSSTPQERKGCLAAILGLGALFGGLAAFTKHAPAGPPAVDRRSLEAGYEVNDADLGKMLRVVIALVVGVIAVVVVATVFQTLVTGRFGLFPLGTTIAVEPNVTPPPAPRLETGNGQVLDELRAKEDQLLNNYTWIDQGAGTVRIPVDRAMDLMLQRGLPTRSQAAGANGVNGPVYSSSGRMTAPQLP
jgi:hypothetical protein